MTIKLKYIPMYYIKHHLDWQIGKIYFLGYLLQYASSLFSFSWFFFHHSITEISMSNTWKKVEENKNIVGKWIDCWILSQLESNWSNPKMMEKKHTYNPKQYSRLYMFAVLWRWTIFFFYILLPITLTSSTWIMLRKYFWIFFLLPNFRYR